MIILVRCIENLSIPLGRARRIVPGTLITIFETHSFTNMSDFYSNMVLILPT